MRGRQSRPLSFFIFFDKIVLANTTGPAAGVDSGLPKVKETACLILEKVPDLDRGASGKLPV